MMKKILSGKVGVIMGLANNRSIAWGIAKVCHDHGGKFSITYQSDIFIRGVKPLADELNCDLLVATIWTGEGGNIIDPAARAGDVLLEYGDFYIIRHARAEDCANEDYKGSVCLTIDDPDHWPTSDTLIQQVNDINLPHMLDMQTGKWMQITDDK